MKCSRYPLIGRTPLKEIKGYGKNPYILLVWVKGVWVLDMRFRGFRALGRPPLPGPWFSLEASWLSRLLEFSERSGLGFRV